MGHTQQHDQGALSDTIAMDKLRDELIQSRVDIQLGAPSLLSLDLEKKHSECQTISELSAFSI